MRRKNAHGCALTIHLPLAVQGQRGTAKVGKRPRRSASAPRICMGEQRYPSLAARPTHDKTC